MESSNQENFFETDTQQAKRHLRAKKEANTFGNPLRMPSKILAVIPDPKKPQSSVLIAESGGRVSRINTETRTTTAKYTGPSVPVTCLATGGASNGVLFAGSWDKTVWSWDLATRRPLRRYDGHSDFVKAVVCGRLGDKPILVSGGADKKIIVWDADSGRKLHTLQDPTTTMMSLQHLAIDPVLSTADEIVLVSASSDPHIRRWRITLDSYSQLPVDETPSSADPAAAAAASSSGEEKLTIQEHETSVYKVLFDVMGDEVDLWTASADGTAKCLVRERAFAAEDVFEHGDFVRAIALTADWVVTGGISQQIKVWDRTSGALRAVVDAHFDEITDLVVLRDPAGRSPDVLCSVGIDCTLRTWPLDHKGLDAVVEEIRAAAEAKAEDEQEGEKKKKGEGKKEEEEEGLMTAEEEAELAALMEDDD
ncbi:WD repeat domain-containing protein [Colletotrichum higginsianum IMI 349063]|uniref:Mitochondrial division protein 1 n=2 Tax=Colletotrichum higginsianum TaxID=80884 RepID=A0A1B7Y1M7_COLHI|nr:WD repeat domain-containing protein [Colletotrichum higginsianum IMI 349063]OBR05924.1 WD repeat domain-containing protein [Colletotrichum higginsianum IMI 349063]TIC97318.1 putative WD repeat-containing protein [Colletotrichum higginsianum]